MQYADLQRFTQLCNLNKSEVAKSSMGNCSPADRAHFRYFLMPHRDILNRQFDEIAESYIIPTTVEPVLRNALAVRQALEESSNEPEKEGIIYRRAKRAIDSEIAAILLNCFVRKVVS